MQRNTLCVLSGSLRSLAALACAAALYIAGAPRAAEASGSIRCTAYDVPVTVAGVPSASIYGELCVPPSGRPPTTVQILVHSTGYNHRYFDPPQPEYSYVRSAVAAGYATFNLDRLGTGRSTTPPAHLVSIATVEDTIHQVVAALRKGDIGSRAFSKVVWVGSSFGSAYGWVNATVHPGDVDAYVLTGIMHYTKPSFFQDLALPSIISACDDPIFTHRNLDCDYITTRLGTKGTLYYYEPGAAPGMVPHGVDDAVIRDVVALPLLAESLARLGGVLSPQPPVAFTPMPVDTDFARAITVPTLIVIGDHDNIFCGPPDGLDCSAAAIARFEAPYYGVTPDVYVARASGHATALHLSGPETAAAMTDWIKGHVSAH